jgi:splicing factor 1
MKVQAKHQHQQSQLQRMARPEAEAQLEVNLRLLCLIQNNFDTFLSSFAADPPADGVKRRKKRNRWGDAQENKAAGLMGLPTMIMANFTNEQLEAYTLHLRIEEISQKLRINDVVPADGDR